ncbi:hypothetical protein ACIOHS_45080 [Streptomyces sp. NPDC088253]|uniref:hypothetical protein n=1 Tax=Streptomyces sp. NPDC088253 TaxID=3365846 RepID=UPI003800E03D
MDLSWRFSGPAAVGSGELQRTRRLQLPVLVDPSHEPALAGPLVDDDGPVPAQPRATLRARRVDEGVVAGQVQPTGSKNVTSPFIPLGNIRPAEFLGKANRLLLLHNYDPAF